MANLRICDDDSTHADGICHKQHVLSVTFFSALVLFAPFASLRRLATAADLLTLKRGVDEMEKPTRKNTAAVPAIKTIASKTRKIELTFGALMIESDARW